MGILKLGFKEEEKVGEEEVNHEFETSSQISPTVHPLECECAECAKLKAKKERLICCCGKLGCPESYRYGIPEADLETLQGLPGYEKERAALQIRAQKNIK